MSDDLVWKARFIVTQDGGVDLPHDRQQVEGPTDGQARVEFLNKLAEAMPPEALFKIIKSKLRSREINTRMAGEVILLDATHEGDRWVIKGNSNASAGYFYVEARIVGPEANAAFEQARTDFHRAQQAMHDAAREELVRIVREAEPDAIAVRVHGSYNDDGEVSLDITEIRTADGWTEEFAEIEEANYPLSYMGTLTSGDDYVGTNDIELVPAPECSQCGGTGYLLDQEYGYADIPDGWTPVQACDECKRFDNDGTAANVASQAKGGVLFQYFNATDDVEHPGDWAIMWEAQP